MLNINIMEGKFYFRKKIFCFLYLLFKKIENIYFSLQNLKIKINKNMLNKNNLYQILNIFFKKISIFLSYFF